MQCFQCGTTIMQGSQFCNNCGKSIGQSQKNKTNLYIILGILGGIFLMCFSCGLIGVIQEQINPQKSNAEKPSPVIEKTTNSNTSKSPKVEPVFNIVNLANKSVEEIEAIIGKPKNIEKKENTFNVEGYIEGEERKYELANPKKSTLEIFYYKGKAVELNLEGLTYWDTTNTAEELAERYGFTGIGNISPDKSMVSPVKWEGSFGGVKFKEIAVSKPVSPYFDRLKAVVYNEEIAKIEEKVKRKVEKPEATKNTENKSRSTPRTLKSSSSSNGYIRGPRGGCYYITSGGSKKYVDRSLCN